MGKEEHGANPSAAAALLVEGGLRGELMCMYAQSCEIDQPTRESTYWAGPTW